MKVLLTGAAGFIGFHTAQLLLERGDEVVGFDNFNDYYDPSLKERRCALLEERDGFRMIRGDVKDRDAVKEAMQGVDRVCHLAAMAGVRYSLKHPEKYVDTNVVGTLNILEEVRHQEIDGLIYASSSSVYGNNEELPFAESQRTDTPIALYGATKKSTELMAHTYHHLFGFPTTGLRFFTVYGPWGRPDMALFLFTDAILHDKPISIFGEGKMQRDFTFIDDIASGVVSAIDHNHDHEVFNLGSGRQEELMDFVTMIEECCGREAQKEMLPMQPGDIRSTLSDVSHARDKLGYDPKTSIAEGIPKFVEWYREYYGC